MSDLTKAVTECRGCAGENGEAAFDDVASNGIGRRTFLVRSGILAAIAALSACGVGAGDATAPTLASNTTIDIASYPSLANIGGVAVLTIGNAPLAIVRTGASSFL